MTINRRTFSALLASAVAVPRVSFAQAKVNSAFYSGGAATAPASSAENVRRLMVTMVPPCRPLLSAIYPGIERSPSRVP